MTFETLICIMVFALGVCVGSFANVCILRIPGRESIVPPSHCMSCSRKLKWYELIPVFSFLAQRGRCRGCKTRISLQYPLIEGINGILWVLVFVVIGIPGITFLYDFTDAGIEYTGFSFPWVSLITPFLLSSAATILLIIAVIDYKTMEIPPSLNYAIGIIGILNLALNYQNWYVYLIGAVSVSGVLLILWFVTGGRALGGGDIKLMAVCGLLLGWKLIIIAFLLGCIIGTIVHVSRMIITKAGRTLAFGPYLALGVFIAMLCGEQILNWYMGLYGWV